MKGQWLGRFSSNDPTGQRAGIILVDIDEVDDHYEGYAVVQNDQQNLPIVFTRFMTSNKSRAHSMTLNLFCIDPRNGAISTWAAVAHLFPGTTPVSNVQASFEYTAAGNLDLHWRSQETGQTGAASILPTEAGSPSALESRRLGWAEFKEYVFDLPPYEFIFRGQQSNVWRLRTSFHRTGRASLVRYEEQDMASISKHLSGQTKHFFNRADPLQYGAFAALIQHHGYPTPLLDWTQSPFVAAFFAFRGIKSPFAEADFVRIFKFDIKAWSRLPQHLILGAAPPHVSVLDAYAMENRRLLPQQASLMMTNVDDIETYIRARERAVDHMFLEAIDIPVAEKRTVARELALMGVGAGSLFPGLDGTCEELRDRYFPA